MDGDKQTVGGRAGLALYPLRVGLAIIFLYTGIEKLLDVEANAAITALIGVPWPEATTVVVGLLEILGAVLIISGVFARTAAAGLSIRLLAILVTLKIPGSFWGDGWGIDIAVLAGTLTLALNGPGRPTIMTMLGRAPADPEARFWRHLASARKTEPIAENPGQAEDVVPAERGG